MQPRLENSKQWTSFPIEYLEMVKRACHEIAPREVESSGQFFVEGQIYTSEILVRIGYLPKGSIRQINAEISVSYDVRKENVKEVMAIAVDCAGAMVVFAIERPLSELPPIWEAHDFEGREVFVQFNGINTELERRANEILGETSEDTLIRGTEPSAEEIKTSLGVHDAEDDETIFH